MKHNYLILILVAVALLAGAFLRLEKLDIMEFKADEGRVLVLVWRWAELGLIPRAGGVTSVIGYFSPLFAYLLALPYALCPDAVWVTSFISLANVFALFLCYLMVKRFWGERAAVVSVILFAVSPWAVLYSRKIWNPNICPTFTIIFFFSLLSIVVDRKSGYILPLVISWLVLVQLHPVYLVLGIVPASAFLIFRPRLRWHHVAAGLLLGLLPAFAYLHFLWLKREHLLGSLGKLLACEGRGATVPLAGSLVQSWRMPFTANLSIFDLQNIVGAPEWAALARLPLTIFFNYAEHALMIIGLLFVIWGVLFAKGGGDGKSPRNPRDVILLLWFLVPSLLFGFARIVISPHYFTILYPSQFILAGLAFEKLWLPSRRRRGLLTAWRAALIVLVAGIAVSQFLFVHRFYLLVEREGGTGGDYGTAYVHKWNAVAFILNRSAGKPFAIGRDFGPVPFFDREYGYLLRNLGGVMPSRNSSLTYVIWDPYRPGNGGGYHEPVPAGWAYLTDIGPLRIYLKEGP